MVGPGRVKSAAMAGDILLCIPGNRAPGNAPRVPISDVVLLQDAQIPTLELFSWLVPSALSVFAGLPSTDKSPNLSWIGAALIWDSLLVLGILGLIRSRLSVREWLFPLCVIG